MGLGLSIVKSIAALHGGVVEARSEVGRGTSIVLSFPAQPVEPLVVLADGAV